MKYRNKFHSHNSINSTLMNMNTDMNSNTSPGDNLENTPWKELKVLGFCSHRASTYPPDRQWLAVFSNWHPSPFLLSEDTDDTDDNDNDDNDDNDGDSSADERQFRLVEQWMMWKKARRYGDEEAALRIMATSDPAEMKRIGRQVKNYDHRDWCNVRYDIVLRGVKAKFMQNHSMLGSLLDTNDQILAEAATYDRVWGIGLHRTDPDTQDPKKWKGLNLLGKALMETRDELLPPSST